MLATVVHDFVIFWLKSNSLVRTSNLHARVVFVFVIALKTKYMGLQYVLIQNVNGNLLLILVAVHANI